jgi:8-oxo-dGTP diphosphatase
MDMKSYVAGFYFDKEGKSVALVHKNRPDWQIGQINAIGGKVEPGESPTNAVAREFLEETGIRVLDWEHVVEIYGPGWEVYFFRSYGIPSNCKTMEDEEIVVHSVDDALRLPNLVSNIYWILPLALDENVKVPLRIPYKTATLQTRRFN